MVPPDSILVSSGSAHWILRRSFDLSRRDSRFAQRRGGAIVAVALVLIGIYGIGIAGCRCMLVGASCPLHEDALLRIVIGFFNAALRTLSLSVHCATKKYVILLPGGGQTLYGTTVRTYLYNTSCMMRITVVPWSSKPFP